MHKGRSEASDRVAHQDRIRELRAMAQYRRDDAARLEAEALELEIAAIDNREYVDFADPITVAA